MAASCVVRHHQNQRQNNEDSFQIFTLVPTGGDIPLTVLAIADGMGGHEHGEDVSREGLLKWSQAITLSLCLEPSINRWPPTPHLQLNMIQKALYDATEEAGVYVRRMVERNHWPLAGTTLVATAIWMNTAVVINLGDSPLFHFQAETGSLTRVTPDHSLAGILLQTGMISPEMARVHEGRSQLEYFLGCPTPPKDPPIAQVTLQPGDLLLLCSDGVSSGIPESDIRHILSQTEPSLDKMADLLIQTACSAGETDNQTLILWRYTHAADRRTASWLSTARPGFALDRSS